MWSDTESSKDYLNFGEVSQLAIDVLKSNEMLPVSIGIFGNWGAGKSSLLKLIEAEIDKDEQKWLVVNFDAWLYQSYDDVRISLLEKIAKILDAAAKDDAGLIVKTKKLLIRVDAIRTLGVIAEAGALVAGIPTGGLLSKAFATFSDLRDGVDDEEEYSEAVDKAKELKKTAGGLIKPEKKKSPAHQIDAFRKEYEEILIQIKKPLVVIIDNLDRCLPQNAIHTLEAIRQFLFLKNTAFIIAADEEMIRTSVSDFFKGASDRHRIDYLDKLIQIPIRVPKAGVREIRSYLYMLFAVETSVNDENLSRLRAGLEKSLQESWKTSPITRQEAIHLSGESIGSILDQAFERADRIAPLLANSPIIQGNPRIVKRLLNVVKMRSKVAQRRSMPLDEAIITKLVIFERCAGADATAELYRMIDAGAGKPAFLKRIESTKSDEAVFEDAPKSWLANPTIKSFVQEWAQLDPKLGDIDLRPAIYLSRETMPIGAYAIGLTQSGQDVLTVLVGTKNMSSPTAVKLLSSLAPEEEVLVMEGVITQLRQVSDWSKQPSGFAGACLLARHSSSAAKVLSRYIIELTSHSTRPAWMSVLLKTETWNGRE